MATKGSKGKKAPPPECRRHHGEPITVFSSKFERCMCLKCAMEKHDLLSDFMPISEGVTLMKDVGKQLADEMTMMSENTKVLKRDRTNFIHKVHATDKSIKANVRKMRDRLVRHLDLIEQKLLNKLKQLVDKSEKNYTKDQHTLQVLEADLKKLKEGMSACLKAGNEIELISGIVDAKIEVESKKDELRTQQERLPSKALQFRPSQGIADFIDTVQDLGEVTLEFPNDEAIDELEDEFDISGQLQSHRSSVLPARSNPPSLPDTSTPLSFTAHDGSPRLSSRYGPKQKQRYGIRSTNPYHSLNNSFNTPIGTRRSNVEGVSFRDQQGDELVDPVHDYGGVRDDPVVLAAEHESPCNLSGIAALTSGRIVVCDQKHKCVQLLNRRSEVLDVLVFRYKPCDVATISENGFVVSFVEKDFVSVFYATNQSVNHVRSVSISGRGGSYSLAFSKNKFAVCRRGEIRVVSSDDGELLHTIQIQAHFPQIAMSDGGSKIYLSDFVGGKVSCMNEMGRVRWEYSQDRLEPSSLAVDLNQLFVADVKGRVLILSTYGILTRDVQCVGHLHALCVDPNTGTLLVTMENNKDKTKSRSIKVISI